MNRTILTFCGIFLIIGCVFATGKDKASTAATAAKRKKLSGQQYMVNTHEYRPLTFTRTYSQPQSKVYYTTYKIFYDNRHAATVIAKHLKKEKRVEVEVKDPGKGRDGTLNIEKTSYDTPGMECFGNRGPVGALSGSKGGATAPTQLRIKFASRRFDYIKVVNISGPHESTGGQVYIYILDEKK